MWTQEGAVTLSEPLANCWGIAHPGGRVHLLTPGNWRDFPVVAIFSDYSSTQGSLRMSLDVYRALWDDPAVMQVARQVRARLAAFPTVKVRSSVALRESALQVVDRTFEITQSMQLLTTLVAFIGVLSALLAVELDKQREIGILSALGLTVAEMRWPGF